jgi:hypothetical protein
MRALLAVVCLLALAPTAQAGSKQYTVNDLGSHRTFAFKSQIIRANESVVFEVFVAGKPLKQMLADVNGKLAMTMRGHGVSVTFVAKRKRAPVRVEVANFRRKPVRVVIRIYAVPPDDTRTQVSPEDKAAQAMSSGPVAER